MSSARTRTILAPAKINLFLHVTGRRDDGYHRLDSLAMFADVGDQIELAPAPDFSFSVRGAFAGSFHAAEKDPGPNSANIAVRMVWEMSRLAQRKPDFRMTLVKNMPLASGLGGGSADAAAIAWALLEWWGMPVYAAPWLPSLLLSLGADVPACFSCRTTRMSGIGEILTPVDAGFEIPVLLINPGKLCPTAEVFRRYALSGASFSEESAMPESFAGRDELLGFLNERHNDLDAAAQGLVPDITDVLNLLRDRRGIKLARMSGSGATCFGLFDDADSALCAAEDIMLERPHWWARAGTLNRVQRY